MDVWMDGWMGGQTDIADDRQDRQGTDGQNVVCQIEKYITDRQMGYNMRQPKADIMV